METWRPIAGTKGFIEVSDEGRVRSLLRGTPRILKTQTDSKGYQRITVTVDRVTTTYKVHREVAKAFVNNPMRLPQVNHKDGNKENNSADNLEWVTNRENAYHAIENGLWMSVFAATKAENERRKKPVIGYYSDETQSFCKHFESVAEAERYVGSRHVTAVLKGRRNQTKGWTFSYKGGDA